MSNVVKTELGVIEMFGEVAQREAELAGILGLVVGAARDRGADPRVRAGRQPRIVRDRRLAKSQEDALATRTGKIVGGEEGAGRLDLGGLLFELPKAFQRQVPGEA